MNTAAALAIFAAAVNVMTGIVAWFIRRAPDWHAARVASGIAFGAGLYNVCSLLLTLDGLDPAVYLGAARAAYVLAALVCAGWVVLAHLSAGASVPQWSRAVRGFVLGALGVTVALAVTGIHLRPTISVIEIPWAGVRYHYAVTTPIGDLYGVLILGLLATAGWRMIVRIRAGEKALTAYVVGFGVFVVCATDEVLVANRVITFLSLADVGFVAAVVPLTIQMVRRLIADGTRLSELTRRLEGDVENRTQERDDARAALVESERLATLGRLAAGVGHEINNPLTYLQFALSEIEDGVTGPALTPDVTTAIGHAREGVARIQKVVEGLRTYSQSGDARVSLDVSEVVRAALRIAGPRVRQHAEVRLQLDRSPAVWGSEPQLVQAIVNLLVNAGQAIDVGGRRGVITVSVGATPDGWAFMSVSDDGPGIAAEQRARLFEPYYTTNASRGGRGLGLFITRGIVDGHGGRLDVQSTSGHGATFVITLPAALEAPVARVAAMAPVAPVALPVELPSAGAPPAPAHRPDVPAAPRGALLLVDDDDLVRAVLCSALQKCWHVTAVAGAREALDALETARFDAIVCDLMMPGMSGIEFDEQLAERWPTLRACTLYLTGGAVNPSAEQFLARAEVRHLMKPVSGSVLNATLAELVRPGTAARR